MGKGSKDELRKIPSLPDYLFNINFNESSKTKDSSQSTVVYRIKTITPIFGGGVDASEPDDKMPIRPSSIRGHLRFWWRATRGACYETLEEMHQKEGEIWGTTERPSPVRILVDVIKKTKSEACAKYVWSSHKKKGEGGFDLNWNSLFEKSNLPYVLFPFQGKPPARKKASPDVAPSKCISSAEFDLKIYFTRIPDANITLEIEAAIWAWVNFGGIGARTRRGCGAIFCKEFAPKSNTKEDINEWYIKATNKFMFHKTNSEKSFPVLNTAPLINRSPMLPNQAWNLTVSLMKNFRQGSIGRNGLGRSHWPEADSLRSITKKGDPRHMTSQTLSAPIDYPAFPRAELGLPLIFQFQSNEADQPNECELYPKNQTRMASPLILRPFGFGDGSKALPMILSLQTKPINELEIKKLDCPPKGLPLLSKNKNINQPTLANYSKSPMGIPFNSALPKRSDKGSAIEAFLSLAINENKYIKVNP